MGKRTITPQQAKQWWNDNEGLNFRPFNENQALKYSRDMRNGKWFYIAGQTIKFDTNHDLIDGFHRVWAIADADVNVEMNVETNYPAEAKHFIDIGKPRTVNNIVGDLGYNDPNNVVAAKRLEIDVITHRRDEKSGANRSSIHEIVQMIEDDEDIQWAVDYARNHVPPRMMPRSVGAYCYSILHKIHPDQAAMFFHGFLEVTDLGSDSPMRALHKKFAYGAWTKHSWKDSKPGPATGRNLRLQQVACIFLAWNAYRNDEGRSQIKTPLDRQGRISIPVPA